MRDKFQAQRFELKYLITEEVARSMREFVRPYLELHGFGRQISTLSYSNHSLYLDSSDLQLYWDVVNGNRNRYKLRLRYYDDDPVTPVFFEIKRRVDNGILKERGAVKREFVAGLLAGQLPELSHLVSCDPKPLAALQHFCRLVHHQEATPKAHVSYLREAWVSRADNSVRVTFDREVRINPHFHPVLTTRMEQPVLPWGKQVVMELKFTERFPDWFQDMVRLFNVVRCGVAKYAEGVAALGEERLNPMYHHPERSDRRARFLREQRKSRRTEKPFVEGDFLAWTTS